MLLNSCSSQKDETDWAKYNLSGKLKSIIENSYEAEEKFGEIVKGESGSPYWENGQITFNENGNIIESNTYDSDGSLGREVTYEYDYDKIGNWVRQIQFTDNDPGTIIEREIEYFD